MIPARRYQVIWDDVLVEHMTERWVDGNATVRQTLTELSHAIELKLGAGEFSSALAFEDDDSVFRFEFRSSGAVASINFRVFEEDRIVYVFRVSIRIGRPKTDP
ncbi:hypothetical protein [Stratiformator vulcanicus]|uniref:Uncharacterized protein n=1 Tax=Stratiformator vulcanicus TaxID=2527980 RepID=A0A517QXW3_9PLAN|nr:hypothetical protein [Stratiformator vulcanicus]QDT36447.1 hypothetical protein Pan189_08030 [Stratiformator vulcanicus]